MAFWFSPPRTHCYLFAHVAKCGGTTLVQAFGSAGKGAICLGDHQRTRAEIRDEAERVIAARRLKPNRIHLFFGHRVHYGLHELSSLPPRYFTFVRHPYQRTISLYNHHCGIADSAGHPFRERDLAIVGPGDRRVSFEQWLEQSYTGNHMVRFLSFAMRGEDATVPGEMTEADLLAAQQFLDQCWFVGLVEKSNLDIPKICEAIGVRVPRERANVSTVYQPPTTDRRLLDKIAQKDALDLRLYDYALQRRQQIEQATETQSSL